MNEPGTNKQTEDHKEREHDEKNRRAGAHSEQRTESAALVRHQSERVRQQRKQAGHKPAGAAADQSINKRLGQAASASHGGEGAVRFGQHHDHRFDKSVKESLLL